ncbi:MAG: HAD family hydrolase [Gammaproteobacteria bacterium]|nr:HAD family hydrolase [Gammaproteobacteria bacterium]
MAKLEALLIDVDGTLADTESEGHRKAFNATFEKFGLNWHWDDVLYGELLKVTGGKERIRFYLDSFDVEEIAVPEELSGVIDRLHQSKTAFYKELMAEGRIPLRSGVHRLLEEARESGLRLAIVTTTSPGNVQALLEKGLDRNWASWFEVVAAGDVVPAKKPAPDIYHWAMSEMGISPDHCLVLEDSRNGLRAALGAGLKSVLITVNEYTAEEDFSGAAMVLDQLGDPGNPCRAIEGNLAGKEWVDVALLKALHRRSYQG